MLLSIDNDSANFMSHMESMEESDSYIMQRKRDSHFDDEAAPKKSKY